MLDEETWDGTKHLELQSTKHQKQTKDSEHPFCWASDLGIPAGQTINQG